MSSSSLLSWGIQLDGYYRPEGHLGFPMCWLQSGSGSSYGEPGAVRGCGLDRARPATPSISLLAGLSWEIPMPRPRSWTAVQRRVFGMTVSVLQDRQAAEEAAQDAFVRAWRHASTYDPRKGTVAAWLLMIARNVSINLLPSHRSYPVDPEVLLELQDPEPPAGPGRPAGAGVRTDAEGADAPSPKSNGGPWCWPSSTATPPAM